MKNLLFALADVLDSTIPVGDLSQSELTTLKSGVQTVRTAVSSNYTSLINQIQAIDSAKDSYDTYKIDFDKTVANLYNLKNKRDADISSYVALVNQAKANYEDAKNPPRDVDIAGYQANLSSAHASLAQAVANRNKAIIFSPVDGVIGKIDVKIGQFVNTQDDIAKVINPHFEIKVDIPETDISKISFGDTAEIKLDAFSDDRVFEGKVTEIEKGETVIQDVVYYTVTLSLEEMDENILNGMTADVLFFTAKKDDVLFVPLRSVIIDENNKKYVRVLESNQVVEKEIVTGLRAYDGLVEIVSGVSEGEDVILKIISN